MIRILKWIHYKLFGIMYNLSLLFYKMFREIPVVDIRLLTYAGWTRAGKKRNQWYITQKWIMFTWRFDWVTNSWDLIVTDLEKCDKMTVIRKIKYISDNPTLLLPHMVSYIWTELPDTHLETFKLPTNEIAAELYKIIQSHQPY